MVQNGWIMFLFSLTPPKKFQTCSERQKRIMRERMKKRKIRRMRKFKTRLLKWTSTEGRRCFWDTEPQVARVWVSSTWEVLATWQAHYRLCITLHRWRTTCGSVITKKKCVRRKSCILCIVMSYLRKSTNLNSSLKPIELWRKLKTISSKFRLMRQEDAHEYTRCLFKVLRRDIIETKLPQMVFEGSRITTPLDAIFGGTTFNAVKCSECSNITS